MKGEKNGGQGRGYTFQTQGIQRKEKPEDWNKKRPRETTTEGKEENKEGKQEGENSKYARIGGTIVKKEGRSHSLYLPDKKRPVA